jgi:hypothetical protein
MGSLRRPRKLLNFAACVVQNLSNLSKLKDLILDLVQPLTSMAQDSHRVKLRRRKPSQRQRLCSNRSKPSHRRSQRTHRHRQHRECQGQKRRRLCGDLGTESEGLWFGKIGLGGPWVWRLWVWRLWVWRTLGLG